MNTTFTFSGAVKSCYKKTFTMSGRAVRSEFWYFVLFTYLVGLVVGGLNIPVAIAGVALSKTPSTVTFISLMSFDVLVSLALYIPLITAAVRRLHDTGRSGAWIWLGLAPTILMVCIPATIAITDHNTRGAIFTSGSPEMISSMLSFAIITVIYLKACIILTFMLALAGTNGPNKYGDNPDEIAQ